MSAGSFLLLSQAAAELLLNCFSWLAETGELRQEPRSDRKLRMAASSPNIKALFDANPSSSSYPYRVPEQDYPGFYPSQHSTQHLHKTTQSQHDQAPPSPFGQFQIPPAPLNDHHWSAPGQSVSFGVLFSAV